jgi:hypothetical protein
MWEAAGFSQSAMRTSQWRHWPGLPRSSQAVLPPPPPCLYLVFLRQEESPPSSPKNVILISFQIFLSLGIPISSLIQSLVFRYHQHNLYDSVHWPVGLNVLVQSPQALTLWRMPGQGLKVTARNTLQSSYSQLFSAYISIKSRNLEQININNEVLLVKVMFC